MNGVQQMLALVEEASKESGKQIDSGRVQAFLETPGSAQAVQDSVGRDMMETAVALHSGKAVASKLFDLYGAQVKNPKEFYKRMLAGVLHIITDVAATSSSTQLSSTVGYITPQEYTLLGSIVAKGMGSWITELFEELDVSKDFKECAPIASELFGGRDA